MLAATNHRDFNIAMNEAAGTQGVQFSQPWNLGVQNGTQFLNDSYDTVGKIYAQQLLHQPHESVLHDFRGELTDLQKALLQHMSSTTTMHDFDKALHACVRHNVMSSGASALFCKHMPVTFQAQSTEHNSVSLSTLGEEVVNEQNSVSLSTLVQEVVNEHDMSIDMATPPSSPVSNSLVSNRRGKNLTNLTLMPKGKRRKI